MEPKQLPAKTLPYTEEAIRFTIDNIPMIEHRSRWYGHHDPLTKKRLKEMFSQYQKDNPDHENPYCVFSTEYPENSAWGWSLVPKVYFDKVYTIDPDRSDESDIEDVFVPVTSSD